MDESSLGSILRGAANTFRQVKRHHPLLISFFKQQKIDISLFRERLDRFLTLRCPFVYSALSQKDKFTHV